MSFEPYFKNYQTLMNKGVERNEGFQKNEIDAEREESAWSFLVPDRGNFKKSARVLESIKNSPRAFVSNSFWLYHGKSIQI